MNRFYFLRKYFFFDCFARIDPFEEKAFDDEVFDELTFEKSTFEDKNVVE